jgi:hypothetical protein
MVHSKFFASLVSVQMVVALSGCGGAGSDGGGVGTTSSRMATVSGSVIGLPARTTLLLVNNGSDNLAVSGSTNFSFSTKLAAGSPYKVLVFGQPWGSACSIENGAGAVASDGSDIGDLSVKCVEAFFAMPDGFVAQIS